MLGKFVSGSVAALALLIPDVLAGSYVQITNFGTNPTGVKAWTYTPSNVASKPAMIVAMHYCTGSAQAYYQSTTYAQLADQHGYIVLYPQAPDSGGCWDVHTTQTLTHNAGGDSQGVASAISYMIANHNVDASRVFATGSSSGAMMTNVMLGAYPNLFSAATAYSGVPYSCFEGPSLWNSQCAEGHVIQTGAQWGNAVRNGYPGYSGARPKFRTYHGTIDTTLYYQNLIEQTKQWPNVFGISFSHNQTNTPQSGYTTMTYGDGTKFIAVSAQGVGHTVPVREADDLQWFGITS